MHRSKTLILTLLLVQMMAAFWTPNAAAEDYKLGTGDKLRIKVHEWPDISGEYLVSPASTVSLPLVGEFPVADSTASALAKTISDRLQTAAKLAATPSCTVEVIAFRPFFVMGDVEHPGEYPYRPSLTTLQAISIAGGYYRPTEAAFRFERDAISARGAILLRSKEVKELTARIARLEAEQKNATSIAFPDDLNASNPPDKTLMDQQRLVFTANNSALADTLKTLEHDVDLDNQEIETINAQITSEKRQLSAVQEEFQSVMKLAEKGLTSLSRRLALERTLSQIQSTIEGLQANILRARQNISQAEQRRLDALSMRMTRINKDLQEAQIKSKESSNALQTARNLLFEAEVIAPTLYARDSDASVEPKFTIMRKQDGKTAQISVDSTAAVLPGDVLTVDRRPNSARQQSGLEPSSKEANASH